MKLLSRLFRALFPEHKETPVIHLLDEDYRRECGRKGVSIDDVPRNERKERGKEVTCGECKVGLFITRVTRDS